MNVIIKSFLDIFGTNSTTNFQLIKWAKMLKIKPFYYAMTDEIKKLPRKDKTFYAIINYNNSNQQGTHHVAFISKDGKRYYFDSYGFEPQKQIIEKYSPLRTSNYQVQKYNTELCGQLSLLVIYLVSKGFEFEDVVLELFGKSFPREDHRLS
jgi:hypothetical protein